MHVEPYPIAQVPLAQLTGQRLDRALPGAGEVRPEGSPGRRGPVRADGPLRAHDPAQRARPGREGRPAAPQPGRRGHAAHCTGGEGPGDAPVGRRPARRVPGLGRGQRANHPLWHMLAIPGCAAARPWRCAGATSTWTRRTVSVRRSAGMVRVAGEGAEVIEGDTKSGKPRRGRPGRRHRGRAARPGSGSAAPWRCSSPAGRPGLRRHRGPAPQPGARLPPVHPRRRAVRPGARAIRLHDLRHTHATMLLLAREPVHVVSQRLGHASPMVTLTVYAHVMPGNQREAANTFARLVREARGA